MALNKQEIQTGGTAPLKKADVILQIEREISAKQDEFVSVVASRLNDVEGQIAKVRQDTLMFASQNGEIYDSLREDYNSIKREMKYLAKQSESIFSSLAETLAGLSRTVSELAAAKSEPVSAQPSPAPIDYDEIAKRLPQPSADATRIDYDELAKRIAALMPVQEVVSADYIASKVAEQIVPLSGDNRVSAVPTEVSEEEIADRIALKVGSLKADEFEIMVDDAGCASISEELAEKLDYERIASTVADKLRATFENDNEPDYDELATRLGEKINVATVNEDSIADKAAAVLSNYLPEFDTDELADKVVGQILPVIPQAVDAETVGNIVYNKIAESKAETETQTEAQIETESLPEEKNDYDIVLDEDGIEKLSAIVSEKIEKRTEERFDAVDREIAEIKALLAAGAVASAAVVEKERTEPSEDELITVSGVVEEAPAEEDGADGGDADDGVIGEIVAGIDEQPASGELMPDGIPGISAPVDFANMMKYNRSFIARIIQGTDEQKNYYGRVKQALLSYKKVNSNIAWGAERFNKGRETIARFKIRGKTLCLYLALDPNEYATSVYHQVDVSDNKSMHGTPMMVKIKSDRGVKKAIRLIDEMLAKRDGVKRAIPDRDYAAMYPYETIEELIEDGLVKDVSKQ